MTSSGHAYIVTGGTGELGRAVVAALLAEGANVGVPFRGTEGFKALQAAHPEAHTALWGARADLGDRSAAAEFVDAARRHFGRLDGVACVAGGYAGSGPLHEAPPAQWDGMLLTNLGSTYAVCRAALPHLARGGAIVTVGARLVETGGAGAAAYVVSKAAVQALTRALAAENRARGVRVNAVAPGIIDTPANRAALPKADFSRWTPPEEIARVIVFLLSPASAPVTGAIVPVDARA